MNLKNLFYQYRKLIYLLIGEAIKKMHSHKLNFMSTNANVINLSKINFSKFADKAKNASEKTKGVKVHIYNYPAHINPTINESEAKSFRGGLRKKLMDFCGRILFAYKQKNVESILTAIKSFDAFYKENYRINDYSIGSLTQTTGEKNVYYQDVLNIIKDIKTSVTPEKKEVVKKAATKKIKTPKTPKNVLTAKEFIAEENKAASTENK